LAALTHLIVTDADFGRAYLRDAWAARFLERMFSSFTVLFVGYSHGDIVMRYLARSLGRQSNRYVLTPKPDASDWRQLNIVPVAYEVKGSSHAALTKGLGKWARLLSMGLLDHRQRIAQLVVAPPSEVPESIRIPIEGGMYRPLGRGRLIQRPSRGSLDLHGCVSRSVQSPRPWPAATADGHLWPPCTRALIGPCASVDRSPRTSVGKTR